MQFRIANTFTDSLAKLTGSEQKAVKTTAFDLHVNPTQPGLRFHKLDRSRDPNFRSVRVSRGIRMIVHQTGNNLLLCYVDHHDNAYQWAERRKVDIHPKTGAAQLVEVRTTVQKITVPSYAASPQEVSPKPPLLTGISDTDLLGFGVPAEWLNDVRNANEDILLELVEHLPSEAAEAVLELAVGGRPQLVKPVAAIADPFEHPDAQRRFRLMTNVEELERALDYPWEKWAVFLHPAQRQIVEKDYAGPFSRGRCRRYRKDHRGNPPGGVSRAHQPGRQDPAHYVFRYLGRCSTHETQAVDLQRASACGTFGSRRH